MAKRGRKTSDDPDLEEFVRSYMEGNPVMAPPPTPAAQARRNLAVDLCRFERYALDIINAHGYSIAVTDGKVYLTERGKAHRRAVYDPKKLDQTARQIENKFKNHKKLTPEQAKLCAAAHIQSLTPEQEEILIAARIALVLPELRRNIADGEFSAAFASSMCRISASVPDPDAGARLISQHLSNAGKKGGGAKKLHEGLQTFINQIVKKLAATGKVTHDQVWQHLVKNYPSRAEEGEGTETKIPDCDDVYVDGDTFCWKDGEGKQDEIKRSSLKRYITRAKTSS